MESHSLPRTSIEQDEHLSFLATEVALFVVLTFTAHLGYFLGLKKCMFVPATIIAYLGMLVESVARAFSKN